MPVTQKIASTLMFIFVLIQVMMLLWFNKN